MPGRRTSTEKPAIPNIVSGWITLAVARHICGPHVSSISSIIRTAKVWSYPMLPLAAPPGRRRASGYGEESQTQHQTQMHRNRETQLGVNLNRRRGAFRSKADRRTIEIYPLF